MSAQKNILKRKERRKFRVRNKFASRGLMPRVSVFRSARHLSAQIIDDAKQVTLVSMSTESLKDEKRNKTELSKEIGIQLGKKAKELSIANVYFDRGSYLYHGRVKALADGLRESGLVF